MTDLFSKYLNILSKDGRYLHLLRNNTLKGTNKTDIMLCLPRWKNKKLTVNGLGGNDYINFKLSTKSNKLYGNDGRDTIYGGRAADTVNGGYGNDYLHGFNGNDKIYGSAGKDTIKGGAGADYVSAGTGNDRVYGNAGNDKIVGGTGNDTIYGNEGADKLYGGAGHDEIEGGSQNDYISGGSGNDELEGGAGNDTILAGSGNDEIEGGAGHDVIHCNSGRNTIEGGTGNDTIHAGSGVDIFEYDGLSGNDLIYHATSADKIVMEDYNNDFRINFSKNGNHVVITRTFSSGAKDSITLANRYLASNGLNRIEVYNDDDVLVRTYKVSDYMEGLSSSVPALKAEVAGWTASTDSADIQTTFDENNTSTTELVSAFIPSDLKI